MSFFIPSSNNLVVGSIQTSKGGLDDNGNIAWQTCSFGVTLAGENVIVIPAIQQREGGDTPNLRIRNANSTGFEYRMEEIRCSKLTMIPDGQTDPVDYTDLKSSGWHTSETLGYVAFCVD